MESTLIYTLGLVATAAFAATGILAALHARIDLFGALVVAVVTAVGGGTVRDVMLDQTIFWLYETDYLICASSTGLLVFLMRRHVRRRGKILLYLDAMGVALFSTTAALNAQLLGLPTSHAVLMGVITGIGGGLIRDTLTHRDTLLVSPELYAIPILIGLVSQVLLIEYNLMSPTYAVLTGALMVFVVRSGAIHFDWRMPGRLINQPDTEN